MINNRFEEINKNDIVYLLDNNVVECKWLEYKEKLPGDSHGAKKEFLADVTSFSNSNGGYIIYGVTEKKDSQGNTGKPEKINGLKGINVDNEKQRLENMIRDSIEPRVKVDIKGVEGFSDGPVIVLYIPQSLSSPHMIKKTKGSSAFFSRNSTGKYPLDVGEIRSAFLASESISDRIRDFRRERLSLILAQETPVPIETIPCIVTHIVPLASFLSFEKRPSLKLDREFTISLTKYWKNIDGHYNIDGYSMHQYDDIKPSRFYYQIFRNGCIEYLASDCYFSDENPYLLLGRHFESVINEFVEQSIKILEGVNVLSPLIVMISILWAKGMGMSVNHQQIIRSKPRKVIKDNLILPEVVLEEYNTAETMELMRPIFDIIWQACGFDGHH